MFTPTMIAMLVATVGAGLTAGLCFSFATFIMTALDRLGPPAAIRAMQSINAVILKSLAMVVWFGTAIVGVTAAVLDGGSALSIAAAALYAVGAILITGRGNVPLNEWLDGIDSESPEAAAAWRRYHGRWQRWNAIRTVVLVLATAGFALRI